MGAESRITELGLELPAVPAPAGTYVPAKRSGALLYVAGHGPLRADGSYVRGRLGDALEVDAGRDAARLTGLALLATIRTEVGSLDRMRQVLKVFGMVNCTADFARMPDVINGCSDLMVDVFGDAGRHARSAVGMAALPFGIAVEVEMVAEVD